MNTLFGPAPRCKYATAYTLLASLVLHGAIVGVAAFWPRSPEPAKVPITVIDNYLPGEVPPSEPAQALPVSAPEPDPLTPPSLVAPAEEMAPPLEEPEMADLEPPKIVLRRDNTTKPLTRTVASASAHTTAHPATALLSPGSGTGAVTGFSGQGRVATSARWKVSSTPAYPYALRRASLQGSGTVRVTTDANGRVESAVMIQSTGSSALDDNTCRHAKADWSGPASASITVPVTYRIP